TGSHLSLALLAAFENPVTAGKLFVDHVAVALSTHFAYAYGGMRAAARDAQPALAPWQERRCEELMMDNLAKDLSLGDLAKECRLSVGRFVRAFKQSTGEAPYRWLLKRRIETAKEMLLFSELAIQEIAVACGFADPRRLTRAFTAVVGTGPEAWLEGQAPRPGRHDYFRRAGRVRGVAPCWLRRPSSDSSDVSPSHWRARRRSPLA